MPENQHQGERLHAHFKTLKKSIEEIAKDLRMSRGMLYYHFRSSDLDEDFTQLLKEKGYEPPFLSGEDMSGKSQKPAKGNIHYVPLYQYGAFVNGYTNRSFIDHLETFTIPNIHGEHFAFQVLGDSMSPYAKPGDIVIAKQQDEPAWMIPGTCYVVQTSNSIRTMVFDKMVSDRAHFRFIKREKVSPAILPLKEIKAVYVAVQILRTSLDCLQETK